MSIEESEKFLVVTGYEEDGTPITIPIDFVGEYQDVKDFLMEHNIPYVELLGLVAVRDINESEDMNIEN